MTDTAPGNAADRLTATVKAKAADCTDLQLEMMIEMVETLEVSETRTIFLHELRGEQHRRAER